MRSVMGHQNHVVVIGGANIDIQGYPHGRLRRHDSNPGNVEITPGGVGRNIAENLARLGLPVRLITAVGNDDAGRLIIRGASQAGVDCSATRVVAEEPTATYLAVLDADGDMDVAIIQSRVHARLDSGYLEQHHSQIESADLIVLDTNLEEALLQYLCRTYGHLPIFIDPVSVVKARKLIPILSGIHTVKPNDLEAESLTGINCRDEDGCKAAAAALCEQGVKNVVISRGSDRLVCADETGVYGVPALRCPVVSTTGAGDAFMTGLVYGYLTGTQLVQAVKYSLVLSSWALGGGSTIAPGISAERLEKEVKHI
ncbi:MAG: kinase [Spirochaetaceae bacterium]|nr:MAG: kinase [Spirochaetaceae bacterium]